MTKCNELVIVVQLIILEWISWFYCHRRCWFVCSTNNNITRQCFDRFVVCLPLFLSIRLSSTHRKHTNNTRDSARMTVHCVMEYHGESSRTTWNIMENSYEPSQSVCRKTSQRQFSDLTAASFFFLSLDVVVVIISQQSKMANGIWRLLDSVDWVCEQASE